MTSGYDLVVLAGGGARRLGGTDKVTLPIDGVSSLERILGSCADADRVVVVGPQRETSRNVIWCREDPPGAGPLAGIAAAIPHTGAPAVVLAAGDMPLVGRATHRLLDSLVAHPDAGAAALVAEDGVREPLAAAYRRTALVRRMSQLGDVVDRPARLLLKRLRVIDVPDAGAAADVDTWDDVYRMEEELRRAR